RNLIISAPLADFRIQPPCVPPRVLEYCQISPNDPNFRRKALYCMLNFYYVEGYIPQYVENSDGQKNSQRLFNDVQYFKTDELNTVDEQLKILIPNNNGGGGGRSPRERLYNAWYNILVERMKMIDEMEFPNITLQEAALFLTQNEGRVEWANIHMKDLNNEAVFSNEMLGNYYFDWFTTKIMVQSILNDESWFNNQNMSLHTDVFTYCYELLTGTEWSSYAGPRREAMRNNIIESVMQHYEQINYTDTEYIRNIARCSGEIQTYELNNEGNLISGNSFEVLWVSGEYFPHDNDYAREIFSDQE
ncbi:MAG: hypothetical protein ACOCWG_02905, partial [bacterium]